MPKLYRLLVPGTLLFLAISSNASRVYRGATLTKHKAAKHPTAKHAGVKRSSMTAAHPRAMDDTRAVQIQTALVKAGYLQDVSGHWDNTSQAAMQKMQADNGWQTKIVPDSRALIKLGLGPDAQASTSSLTAPATGSK